ncbi:MAG TPA: phosphoribosyltransferase family protein [Pseudonocardia sp.]
MTNPANATTSRTSGSRPGLPAAQRTVVERLGVRLSGPVDGLDPQVLLGLALRDNPRRAQLLVSRVLGKHIPTDPRLVHAAALLLGGLVADVLAGRPRRALPVALVHAAVRGEPGAAAALLGGITASPTPADPTDADPTDANPTDAVVLGFAETATALGHGVAEALGGVDYLHSTRRPVSGFGPSGEFTEEHSHHTDHLLLPSDPELLARPRPLVLVDDELSTGRTVVNTIAALHRVAPREHYVVAALVDLRGSELTGLPDGVRVDVVSLARAALTMPDDLAERAAGLRAELRAAEHRPADPDAREVPAATGRVALAELGWPAELPAGGRHGFTPAHHRELAAVLPELAASLARAADVRADERTLVLGTEELMALPLRLAAALASLQDAGAAPTRPQEGHLAVAEPAVPGAVPGVWFSTTTRSPAFVVDEPHYALTSGITFPAHDDPAEGPGPRYAYNVAEDWDHVLVVVDPPAESPALHTGLVAALAPHARRRTVVVTP